MAPSTVWQAVSYEDWSETCDTLHAHTQVLGKLAVKLARVWFAGVKKAEADRPAAARRRAADHLGETSASGRQRSA